MAGKTSYLILAAALSLAGCERTSSSRPTDGVTDALLVDVPDGEWLSYGRDYGEERFSPLVQISDGNVGELGLSWYSDFDTSRGQEATPLVHDGVLYVTTAWSMVRAYDARTGALEWSYDPEVPRETLVRACCDAVNRGVALYGDKVYLGTLDGRLVALDAKTGKPVFDKIVVPDPRNYTITGAPRVAKGMVFLGSGGAEYKARGYLAAYDAQTGEEVWKFHTVPGNPADGFENDAMARAAKTWSGEWWKLGGGGTVWDSITYDPQTDLVLFGTGNADPWNPAPVGRDGDNLYTSSIVAVHADTGEYAWHFQETPEDRWDYDSNAQITVTDLTIDGTKRHVALHAPKNGYFYVLDARTGAFISAGSLVHQNWTTGIDARTGRPRINPQARYEKTGKPFVASPSIPGAHNWHPMSYSPKTGLVYIPVNPILHFSFVPAQDWTPSDIGFQTGLDTNISSDPTKWESNATQMGALVAWDPVAQKEVWRADGFQLPCCGTLATAGNLVFRGGADGSFKAFSADKGAELWTFDAKSGIVAAPMTYALDGTQYVAVLTGPGMANIDPANKGLGRLLVFKLGASLTLPSPAAARRVLAPPPFKGTQKQVTKGGGLYGRYCQACHGNAAVAAGPGNPDLRYSAVLNSADTFQTIVIGGALSPYGMVSFKSSLTDADAEAIRQYVIKRANEDKANAREDKNHEH